MNRDRRKVESLPPIGKNAQPIVEFEQAPHTPKMHQARVERDPFIRSEQRFTEDPG